MRRVLVLALVALIVASVLTVAAQPQPACPRVNKGLELYKRARDRILTIAEKLGVADKVKEALSRADALAEEARALAERGNCTAAAAKLKKAFIILRGIAKKLKLGVKVERRIRAAIRRLASTLARLWKAANRLEQLGYNVSKVKDLIKQAGSLLKKADQALKGGRIREAAAAVKKAAQLTREAAKLLREIASKAHGPGTRENLVKRVDEFIARFTKRLEELKARNPELASEIENAVKPLLNKLREAAEKGDVAEARRVWRQIVSVITAKVREARAHRRA